MCCSSSVMQKCCSCCWWTDSLKAVKSESALNPESINITYFLAMYFHFSLDETHSDEILTNLSQAAMCHLSDPLALYLFYFTEHCTVFLCGEFALTSTPEKVVSFLMYFPIVINLSYCWMMHSRLLEMKTIKWKEDVCFSCNCFCLQNYTLWLVMVLS